MAKAEKQDQVEGLAKLVIADLVEDGVKVKNLKVLNDILKHPQNPKYKLEAETIAQIKKLSPQETLLLKGEIIGKYKLDKDNFIEELVEFFKDLWKVISPAASVVAQTAVEIGAKAAEKAVQKELDGEMGAVVSSEVGQVIRVSGDVIGSKLGLDLQQAATKASTDSVALAGADQGTDALEVAS